MSQAQREFLLSQAIAETHAWYFERNPACRRVVQLRGVGRSLVREQWARVLSTTAHVFKGYIIDNGQALCYIEFAARLIATYCLQILLQVFPC